MNNVNEFNTKQNRISIKYEVEDNGKIVEKELPFVIGVLGDFACNSEYANKQLKDKKFIEINKDNFDYVMRIISPTINIDVDDIIKGPAAKKKLNLNLIFNKMSDFDPSSIIKQIEPAMQLLKMRDALRELMLNIDRSDELEDLLEELLQDSDEVRNMYEYFAEQEDNYIHTGDMPC